MINNAGECAKRSGKYSFGVDEAKTVAALRRLADEIESGKVSLFSISTSSHASHEEFTVREVTIEVLEENSGNGPQVIKG
jgi:hypothetical protein